jgi:Cytochrome bd terminal oxidase subunit I
MTSLELARWQFAITTLYHFIFVPVTIGLAICVAYFQTRWHRSAFALGVACRGASPASPATARGCSRSLTSGPGSTPSTRSSSCVAAG